MTSAAVAGIHVGAVSSWLEANVADATGPFSFRRIAGGHSNLTFDVQAASGHRLVLRRPPLGQVLATAHDVLREAHIVGALGGSSVPVPELAGCCPDAEVTGAPFYVMRFHEGHVLRDAGEVERLLPPGARHAAGASLAEVLARLHRLHPSAVGLGDLARHDGYVERQLERWRAQFEVSNGLVGRPLPAIDRVYRELRSSVPAPQAVSVVHGDYRVDNCLIGHDGEVVAVLDWELCTLGDPLADLGVVLAYWPDASEPEGIGVGRGPTLARGFPSRAQLLAWYERASGFDLGGLGFYVAFGYWKLACVLEGVLARYSAGAMGASADAAEIDRAVVRLAERALLAC